MSETSELLPDDLQSAVHPDDSSQEAGPNERSVAIWRLAIIGVLIIFVGFLTVGLYKSNRSENRATGQAPAFEFTTFQGETIRLEDLRGKGVVVNFWASWCGPCRDEAALLEETWRREKDKGIVFIGLDYLDQEPAAQAYLAEFGISYPNGPDLQSAIARRYGIKGVPETFFINPNGEIVDVIIGPIVDPMVMEKELDAIRPGQ
jgi:cytochrome c biogenesis protein CcmG/thiol:disulfide interchange protein DsbE